MVNTTPGVAAGTSATNTKDLGQAGVSSVSAHEAVQNAATAAALSNATNLRNQRTTATGSGTTTTMIVHDMVAAAVLAGQVRNLTTTATGTSTAPAVVSVTGLATDQLATSQRITGTVAATTVATAVAYQMNSQITTQRKKTQAIRQTSLIWERAQEQVTMKQSRPLTDAEITHFAKRLKQQKQVQTKNCLMESSRLYQQDNNTSHTNTLHTRYKIIAELNRKQEHQCSTKLQTTKQPPKLLSNQADSGVNYDVLTTMQITHNHAEKTAKNQLSMPNSATSVALAKSLTSSIMVNTTPADAAGTSATITKASGQTGVSSVSAQEAVQTKNCLLESSRLYQQDNNTSHTNTLHARCKIIAELNRKQEHQCSTKLQTTKQPPKLLSNQADSRVNYDVLTPMQITHNHAEKTVKNQLSMINLQPNSATSVTLTKSLTSSIKVNTTPGVATGTSATFTKALGQAGVSSVSAQEAVQVPIKKITGKAKKGNAKKGTGISPVSISTPENDVQIVQHNPAVGNSQQVKGLPSAMMILQIPQAMNVMPQNLPVAQVISSQTRTQQLSQNLSTINIAPPVAVQNVPQGSSMSSPSATIVQQMPTDSTIQSPTHVVTHSVTIANSTPASAALSSPQTTTVEADTGCQAAASSLTEQQKASPYTMRLRNPPK